MNATRGHNRPLLLPAPLEPGDTIALFCPSGPVRDSEAVQTGIDWLHQQGYRVQSSCNVYGTIPEEEYLAGPDADRAEELHRLWLDKNIKALWAVRGGFGCLRLLELLDFDLFCKNPKLVIGFSDVTGLLAALATRSGLISLHGPVMSTVANSKKRNRSQLATILQGTYKLNTMTCEVPRPGTATGQLVVGNLTTLVHLMATPWEPDLNQAILVIEDTGESLYRVDRMLTHLSLAGRLDTLAGLILARFDHGRGRNFTKEEQKQLIQRALFLTRKCACPLWSGFPLGHGRDNQPLPFGMAATMNEQGALVLHPELCRKGK